MQSLKRDFSNLAKGLIFKKQAIKPAEKG